MPAKVSVVLNSLAVICCPPIGFLHVLWPSPLASVLCQGLVATFAVLLHFSTLDTSYGDPYGVSLGVRTEGFFVWHSHLLGFCVDLLLAEVGSDPVCTKHCAYTHFPFSLAFFLLRITSSLHLLDLLLMRLVRTLSARCTVHTFTSYAARIRVSVQL